MKAKFLILFSVLFCMILMPFGLMAQTAEATQETVFTVDLGTFTGIVAVVSFLVTQLAKLIKPIDKHRWAKILTSVAVGVLICLGCWATALTPFLLGLPIWQVIIYGAGAGLSGCGFYAVVKPFLNMLPKAQEVDEDDEEY